MTTGVGVAARVGVAAWVGAGVAARVGAGVAARVGVMARVGVEVAVRALDVGWAEPFPVGRNDVTAGEGLAGGDDEQPETAAKPRTAMAPQPSAVRRAGSAVRRAGSAGPDQGVRTLFRYPADHGRISTCHQDRDGSDPPAGG